QRAIDGDRRRARPLRGHAVHDLVGAQRLVAFGQRFQHLAADWRQALAARRAQTFGMRHGVGRAAAMVMTGFRKDGSHDVSYPAARRVSKPHAVADRANTRQITRIAPMRPAATRPAPRRWRPSSPPVDVRYRPPPATRRGTARAGPPEIS